MRRTASGLMAPAAVRALRRLVDEMEALQVDRAHELGWPWGDIAGSLGVSRQLGAPEAHAVACEDPASGFAAGGGV
ncbi:hypothetical protein [Streptomyces violaceusniger]|uniref:hypothetical protein n=1 Tax=Streptomyces violaceusniger TaxID=68280 RepID=UPI003828233E